MKTLQEFLFTITLIFLSVAGVSTFFNLYGLRNLSIIIMIVCLVLFIVYDIIDKYLTSKGL